MLYRYWSVQHTVTKINCLQQDTALALLLQLLQRNRPYVLSNTHTHIHTYTHTSNVHAWPPYKIIFLSIPNPSAAIPSKLLREMLVPSQPPASRPYVCTRCPIFRLMSRSLAFCIFPFPTLSSSGFNVSGTAQNECPRGDRQLRCDLTEHNS